MQIPTSFGEIRSWRKQDAEALAKYANNSKVWLNMRDGFPSPFTQTNAQTFLETANRQNSTTLFAIATFEEAIGGIGIALNQDVHRLTAELGYWLGEQYWGKGIMTEAVTKFNEFAFKHFDLVRIYADPYASNTGSQHVLEKEGFVLERRLR